MKDSVMRHIGGLTQSLRSRGLWSTLRIAFSTLWCTLLDMLDERRFRTQTAGNLPLESLDIQSENKAHAGPYCTPSQFRLIHKALGAVRALRTADFSEGT